MSGRKQATIPQSKTRLVRFIRYVMVFVPLALVIALSIATSAGALGVLFRVDTDASGAQATYYNNWIPSSFALSSDGRYAAFESAASNLVPGDSDQCPSPYLADEQNCPDVFVKNTASGEIRMASADSAGNPLPGGSLGASMSADGRYVAFNAASAVYNPPPYTLFNFNQTKRKDMVTGELQDVGDAGSCRTLGKTAISADGRYVVYITNCGYGSLTYGWTEAFDYGDIHMKDMTTGTVTEVGYGGGPSISDDGRYISYNKCPNGDCSFSSATYRRNNSTGTEEIVSAEPNGYYGTDPENFGNTSISADGRFIAFVSRGPADHLSAPGDSVYVKDMVSGQVKRAAADGAGNQANDGSYNPSISANGRYVAFESRASNLGDNGACQPGYHFDYERSGGGDFSPCFIGGIFVKDMETGSIELASVSSTGTPANDESAAAALSPDGSRVAFGSWATNLVPGDTNDSPDVFVSDTGMRSGPAPSKTEQYGLGNDLLYVANGRASNVAVLDVASMSIVDYIPVPRPPINANALAGQLGATLDKTLQGLGLSAPVHVPDMFYWEIHGVVPSADRGSIYAQGALSFTPADWTLYQIDTKTKQNTRQIPMAISPVGYCGLEYDRNDENSGVLYAESMETGPADLSQLFGSPLQLKDPLAGTLNMLGLSGILNSVENLVPAAVGGLSEENLSSGTNTRFISTDYDADGSSSTCGIAWNASGDRAFASQMFEPLIDKINWSTKTVDGEITPPMPFRTTQHQETSAKSRGLLFVAQGSDGVAVYDMNLNALVGMININSMIGRGIITHGVEVSPVNDSVIYVTGDALPSAGTYVFDVSDINSPKLIGGLDKGLDPSACGTYAIGDKQDYYRASGKCQKPNLSYAKTSTYWASYSDYANRDLSVNFNIMVSGSTAADNVTITGASATDGVTTLTPMPLSVGNVTNTRAATTTIRYHVPDGVVSFRTALSAKAQSPCGDSYSYPGASVVGVPPAPPQA